MPGVHMWGIAGGGRVPACAALRPHSCNPAVAEHEACCRGKPAGAPPPGQGLTSASASRKSCAWSGPSSATAWGGGGEAEGVGRAGSRGRGTERRAGMGVLRWRGRPRKPSRHPAGTRLPLVQAPPACTPAGSPRAHDGQGGGGGVAAALVHRVCQGLGGGQRKLAALAREAARGAVVGQRLAAGGGWGVARGRGVRPAIWRRLKQPGGRGSTAPDACCACPWAGQACLKATAMA